MGSPIKHRPAWVEQEVRDRNGRLLRVRLNKSRAIRAFCTECLGWATHPRECTATHCPLYAWRGAFNPAKGAKGRKVAVTLRNADTASQDRLVPPVEASATREASPGDCRSSSGPPEGAASEPRGGRQ
jgi:hypothetical protein